MPRGWAEQENEFSGHFNKLLKNYRFPYSCIGQLVPLCTNYLLGRFWMLLLFCRFHFMIFSIIWNRSAENRKSLPASQTFFANTLGCYTRKWNHATGFWFSISILWIHLWFSEIIAGKKILFEIIAGRKITLWIIFRIFCFSLTWYHNWMGVDPWYERANKRLLNLQKFHFRLSKISIKSSTCALHLWWTNSWVPSWHQCKASIDHAWTG